MQYDPNLEPEDQLLSDLLNLRALFSRRGSWANGEWESDSNAYCIMGGIQKVVYGKVELETNITTQKAGSFYQRLKGGLGRVKDLVSIINKARLYNKKYDHVATEICCYDEQDEETLLIAWNDSQRRKTPIVKTIDRAIALRMEEKTLERARQAVPA